MQERGKTLEKRRAEMQELSNDGGAASQPGCSRLHHCRIRNEEPARLHLLLSAGSPVLLVRSLQTAPAPCQQVAQLLLQELMTTTSCMDPSQQSSNPRWELYRLGLPQTFQFLLILGRLLGSSKCSMQDEGLQDCNMATRILGTLRGARTTVLLLHLLKLLHYVSSQNRGTLGQGPQQQIEAQGQHEDIEGTVFVRLRFPNFWVLLTSLLTRGLYWAGCCGMKAVSCLELTGVRRGRKGLASARVLP